MCKLPAPILQEIFPSSEMASYLTKCSLQQWQIRDAIAYAAIPLKQKRDMFLQLALGKNKSHFRRQAGYIEQAIREMQPKSGEFFYLKCHYYVEDQTEEKGLEPYLTWNHIFERIQQYLGYLDDEEKEMTWFQVEKWSPDGTGKLKNDYDYTVFGTEVCYFSHNTSSNWDWYKFSEDVDLNLPVPFHAGDIVTIDCRPFAPVNHAVILEVGDNWDCCCLQALYREVDGTWDTGAVKHGHVSPNRFVGLSPLYRLATFHGQLPEEEHLLETVSSFLNGDEEHGAALGDYIFEIKNKEWEKAKVRKWSVTEAQILSYIESDMLHMKEHDEHDV